MVKLIKNDQHDQSDQNGQKNDKMVALKINNKDVQSDTY